MRTKVTRIVPARPEDAFAVAADPAMPGGLTGEPVEGQGAGARLRRADRIGPHRVVSHVVVTGYEPPRRLAWRTEHEAFEHEAEMLFLPHRHGTRIVQVDREHWHHAPWWRLPAARRSVRRELQRRLAWLEQALEHGA